MTHSSDALCAVNVALWDIKGKAAGMSICESLGRLHSSDGRRSWDRSAHHSLTVGSKSIFPNRMQRPRAGLSPRCGTRSSSASPRRQDAARRHGISFDGALFDSKLRDYLKIWDSEEAPRAVARRAS
jgi:hypothetical protein